MAKHCNPADPCAVYLAEIEQLETKLRSLRERATQARRIARNKHAIYWAHVSEMQHLNAKLAEVLACWQIEVNGKAATRCATAIEKQHVSNLFADK